MNHINPTSFEFFRGKSLFTGRPIVGIVCCDATNRKTGPLAQSYILSADEHPVEHVRAGSATVCGDCPLQRWITARQQGSGGCYVVHGHGPAAVWSSWCAGRIRRLDDVEDAELQRIFGRCEGLRYGAYGDPVAIPRLGWVSLETIVTRFAGNVRTGYTHAWREARFQTWRRRLMASVESPEDAFEARELGWRYFRIGSEKLPGDVLCPSAHKTCSNCGACNGSWGAADQRVSIWIAPHGVHAGAIPAN